MATQFISPYESPQSARTRTAWLPTLFSGIVIGFTEVVFALSLASLIFSGPLAPALPRGIGFALFSIAIHAAVATVWPAMRGLVVVVQDNPSVLTALAVASVAATLSISNPASLLPTVLVLIMVSTVLVGVVLALLGTFRLGGLVRYIPYPVIGGFLASTGFLLVRGGFGILTPVPVTWENLPTLFTGDQVLLWGPGVATATLLFFGLRRLKGAFTFPALLLLAVILFYVALILTGTSLDSANARGLLLSGVGGAVWQPITGDEIALVDWGAVLGQSGNIAAIVGVVVVAVLLGISAIEVARREDTDLNSALRAIGLSNLIAGAGGGLIGYTTVSLSILNHRMKANSRVTNTAAGVLALFSLFVGSAVLAYIPKALLGGLLMFLGAGFLTDWIINGARRLSRPDYFVVLAILVIVGTSGFVTGVTVGLVLMVVLFVRDASRSSIFRSALSGMETVGNVLRPQAERDYLDRASGCIYIIELQGFLFFGTANGVLEKVRARIFSTNDLPLRFLILDFRRVVGQDSSAALSFTKIRQLVESKKIFLILSGLSDAGKRELERSGLTADETLHFAPDFNFALEWCEDLLLADADRPTFVALSLSEQLTQIGMPQEMAIQLMAYLTRRKLAIGETLIRQGEPSDTIYFIESGEISAYVEVGPTRQLRLQKITAGTTLGEVGLFLNMPRTASNIADTPCVVYGITREAIARMDKENPALSAAFNQLLVKLLATRLMAANRERAALLR